jgi:hypothetical protein
MHLDRWLVVLLLAAVPLLAVAGSSAASPGASCRWRTAAVEEPHPNLFNALNSVTATPSGRAWAIGSYYTGKEAGPSGAFIEEWMGRRWQLVGRPLPNAGLWSVSASDNNDAWAVGDHLAEHWNGHTWRRVRTAHVSGRSILHAVAAVGPRNVWLVGSKWQGAGTRAETLVEHWNGSRWSVVPTPNPPQVASRQDAGFQAVSARSASDVWAVGYEIVGGRGATVRHGKPAAGTLIEHWNGRRWQIVPSPSVRASNGVLNDNLFSVSADRSNDAWAAGSWGSGHILGYGGGGDHALVLHWNGQSWSRASLPKIPMRSLLGGVAARNGRAWAVGDKGEQPRQSTLVERWNGTAWAESGSPSGYMLTAISIPRRGDGWAVGSAGKKPLAARLVCGRS